MRTQRINCKLVGFAHSWLPLRFLDMLSSFWGNIEPSLELNSIYRHYLLFFFGCHKCYMLLHLVDCRVACSAMKLAPILEKRLKYPPPLGGKSQYLLILFLAPRGWYWISEIRLNIMYHFSLLWLRKRWENGHDPWALPLCTLAWERSKIMWWILWLESQNPVFLRSYPALLAICCNKKSVWDWITGASLPSTNVKLWCVNDLSDCLLSSQCKSTRGLNYIMAEGVEAFGECQRTATSFTSLFQSG